MMFKNISCVLIWSENYKKLEVKIIAKPFKAPTFDKWFCTFEDPDGNILQVIGPK